MQRLALLALALVPALAAQGPVEHARGLYQRTDYDAALKILLASGEKDGPAWALMGRCHYMKGDFKPASEALEKAVAAEPGRSEYHLWLGRAYGRRAETSSFLTAPGLATKARRSFEKAVELDSGNREAMSDLFEYYLQAPGFLGGGTDKAEALAGKMQQLDPAQYHYLQAALAEKRKEWGAAEQQLRRAAELAPQQAGRVVDLARFLARQGRHQESDTWFQKATQMAPRSPRVIFERARTYLQARRNQGEARALLEQYLALPLTPEDPPREEAEKLLKQAGS